MDYKELVSRLRNELEREGYEIAVSTIRKYVFLKLAPPPELHYLGRGKGKQAEYPDEALGELYAAWKLLNGPIQTSLDRLHEVRRLALELKKNEEIEIETSTIHELKLLTRDLAYLIELWLNYYQAMVDDNLSYRINIDWLSKKTKFSLEEHSKGIKFTTVKK